jgi:hypothetical protein
MEANVSTLSRSPHTPSMTDTTGRIFLPNPPYPVWTTMVLNTSTSGSGQIPSMEATTVAFTQSVTGPPFSYGMPSFDRNFVLTYSTLQTMGLGVGSSNTHLVEDRYLLLPPFSLVLSSHLLGQTKTTTCLEQAV